MKHRRLAAIVFAVLLLAATFAGCARTTINETSAPVESEVSPDPAPESDEPKDVAPEEAYAPAPDSPAVAPFQSDLVTRYPAQAAALLQPECGEEDAAAKTVASGANRFALRLSNELVSKEPGKNFVCSPCSVWLPLAALLNATDEAHRDALLVSLGAQGVTEADLNRAASRMLYDLTKERNREYRISDPLQIANAVFVDKDSKLNGEFAQSFLDYFRGQALNVDFPAMRQSKKSTAGPVKIRRG